jgi:hypothetical protein
MARLVAKAVKEAQKVADSARRSLQALGESAPRKLVALAADLEVTAQRRGPDRRADLATCRRRHHPRRSNPIGLTP